MVDPDAIVAALTKDTPPETFDTGTMHPDILRVWKQGRKAVYIGYRKPQFTGIWFDGDDKPLRVKLPAMVMARMVNGKSIQYSVFAVDRLPLHDKSQLYHAPLPNVGNSGVCWGSVSKIGEGAQHIADLTPDWDQLLGSRFNSHGVSTKSKKHRNDIRNMLKERDGKKTKYPIKDLIPSGEYGTWVKGLLS